MGEGQGWYQDRFVGGYRGNGAAYPGAVAAAVTTTMGTMKTTGRLGGNVKEGDDGGGGRRGRVNYSGNVRSADSRMRRGEKGSILIPVASAKSPPSSSASVLAPSFSMTANAGKGGEGG